MSESLRLVAGAVLLGAGAALLIVALLGARSRLPRNRFAGVRTAATLRTEAGFVLANRVAAAPLGAAGAVAAVGGLTVLLAGPAPVGWVVLALAGIGMLVLAAVGGAVGDRAATRLATQEPGPSACAGACAGCDLVAGCRPRVAGAE